MRQAARSISAMVDQETFATYAAIQHDKTWDIAKRELPILLAEVEQLLA
jgi:hypothetical protein